MLDNGMRYQLGFLLHYLSFIKLTFPLNFNLVVCQLYLFDPRQRLFIAFGQRISTDRFHVSERLACTAMNYSILEIHIQFGSLRSNHLHCNAAIQEVCIHVHFWHTVSDSRPSVPYAKATSVLS